MRKPVPPPEIHWRYNMDPPGDQVRVWRSDWFGDQFEIMDTTQFFSVIMPAFSKFGFRILKAEDD